ncbi:MAG TPA: response regulator, partial [Oligoflexia bacterium]|nr:response regulator [Oligoflexia bacterium]
MQEESNKNTDSLNELLFSAAGTLVHARERSVLLVEDTAAHAAIIRRALDPSIWAVQHVTRGSLALDAFSENPHAIVLLDLSLPDSSGLLVLKRLRALNADAPIIVVTSIDQVSMSVEAMQAGAWNYVVKADPKETAARITSAVEEAWQRRIKSAEARLVDQARIAQLVRNERLEAVESLMRALCTEVNNPLSGILALAQILLEHRNLEPDLRQIAENIALSAAKALEVVQRL